MLWLAQVIYRVYHLFPALGVCDSFQFSPPEKLTCKSFQKQQLCIFITVLQGETIFENVCFTFLDRFLVMKMPKKSKLNRK